MFGRAAKTDKARTGPKDEERKGKTQKMSDVNLDEVLPRFHVMAGSLKAMIEREIKTLTCNDAEYDAIHEYLIVTNDMIHSFNQIRNAVNDGRL